MNLRLNIPFPKVSPEHARFREERGVSQDPYPCSGGFLFHVGWHYGIGAWKMARPTLDRHPKFRRMMRVLNISRPLARGYLELMWDAANESGQITFKNCEEVAAVMDYEGDACQLCTSLCEIGFLDLTVDGEYSIHDYWHHCPDYVKSRHRMEIRRKTLTKDITLKDMKSSKQFETVPKSLPLPAPCTLHPAPVFNIEEGLPSSHSVRTEEPKREAFDALRTQIQSAWNEMAANHGLPQLQSWNEARKKQLRTRCSDTYWRNNWLQALKRVPLNPWNLGENDRGWLATPDWFLRDKTVPSLMESVTARKSPSTVQDILI